MKIDPFLGAMGIPALQALHGQWCPGKRYSSSKAELQRALRKAMLDEARIAKLLERLGSVELRVLRAFLQAPDTKLPWDSELVERAMADRGEVSEAVETLIQFGFIGWPLASSRFSGAEELVMPAELAERLMTLLDVELREPMRLVSLRAHLESLPSEDRQQLLEHHGLAGLAGDLDESVRRLATPDAIRERLAAAGSAFVEKFECVRNEHYGLAPCSCIFRGKTAPANAKAWRERAEQALVGTVGELPMYRLGVEDSGAYLVLFREVCDALCTPQPNAAAEGLTVAAEGADFLIDVCNMCAQLSDRALPMTQQRKLFKSAARRLQDSFVQESCFKLDAEELFEMKLRAAGELKLLRTCDETVLTTTHYAGWRKLALEERVAQLMWCISETRSIYGWFSELIGAVSAELASMQTGAWHPAATPVCRYLGARMLERSLWDGGHRDESVYGFNYGWSRATSVAELCDRMLHSALSVLQALGVVDLALAGGEPRLIRLTPLGEHVIKQTSVSQDEAAPAPGLIVNPDFEVLVLPEGDIHQVPVSPSLYHLLYDLGQFSQREKTTHQTRHYRITRASIERATIGGMQTGEIMGLLQKHSRTPIPQNVEYSIRGWAEGVRLATAQTVHLLELEDEHTLQVAIELPEVQPLVIRQISPNAVILRDIPRDRATLDALRKIGVHLATPVAPDGDED